MGETWEAKAKAAREADPAGDPIPRPHPIEQAKAIAVDAARLALNLGALSQAIAQSADEYMAVWKIGKQCADLLLEGERHLKNAMAELDATKDELREQVALTAQYEATGQRQALTIAGLGKDMEAALLKAIEAVAERDQAVRHFEALRTSIGSIQTVDDEAAVLRAQLERMRVSDKAMRATICERLYLPPETEWSGILPLIGKR